MITIILCALVCAALTLALIMPIAKTHKRLSYVLMALLPLVSLGLYLLLGSPGF